MKRPGRRAVLRGLGVSVALPWLETLGAARRGRAFAGEAAGEATAPPLRLAFVYVPNGVHLADWIPSVEGHLRRAPLPPTLEPLQKLVGRLLVLSGLGLDAEPVEGPPPAGHHARALAGFLTGERPSPTEGADLRAGVSADQVVAQRRGELTRLPSLELACDPPGPSGPCDRGYGGAYCSHLSWKAPALPAGRETDPALVFDRLFGAGALDPRRDRARASVLDAVRQDVEALAPRLGPSDRAKVDQYLTGVREVERRLARAALFRPARPPGWAARPRWRAAGEATDHQTQVRLMCDLMVMAFQADITRVATFLVGNEGSRRSFPALDVHDAHADLAHQTPTPETERKLARIDRYHVTQLAYLLEKLQAVREGEGTLLDQAMVVYGSGLSDGSRHSHDDLPILLAGGGGGTLKPGRHLRYPPATPLANLHLSLLARMKAPVDALGNSTGPLRDL